MVCSITRGPTNPIWAPGSAMITSPSEAKLAVTPPKVGSVRIEMNASPSLSWRAAAAETLAICMSESMPSCMRAPPLAATLTIGTRRRLACSKALATFSPTTDPIVPPRNPKSTTASTTRRPPIRQ